jgi:hypothetical protein
MRVVLESDDRFAHVGVRRYDWDQSYTGAQYRDLMLSYSPTLLMEPRARRGARRCDSCQRRNRVGHATPELPGRDNPNTAVDEQAAMPSHIVLDKDFGQGEIEPGADGVALMRATAAHEFHHAIQFGYDSGEPMQWYGEAASAWMETVTPPSRTPPGTSRDSSTTRTLPRSAR